MQFLMGLTDGYQVLRSAILMLKPLPSVSQASSMILQEEQQKIRNVVPSHPVEVGASGLLSRHNGPVTHSRQPQFHFHSHGDVTSQPYTNYANIPNNRRTNVQCNYYKKPGYTINKCYKL